MLSFGRFISSIFFYPGIPSLPSSWMWGFLITQLLYIVKHLPLLCFYIFAVSYFPVCFNNSFLSWPGYQIPICRIRGERSTKCASQLSRLYYAIFFFIIFERNAMMQIRVNVWLVLKLVIIFFPRLRPYKHFFLKDTNHTDGYQN